MSPSKRSLSGSSVGTRGGVNASQSRSSSESSLATRRTALASSGISSSATRRLRHSGVAPTSESSAVPLSVALPESSTVAYCSSRSRPFCSTPLTSWW